MTEMTGGRVFPVGNLGELPDIAGKKIGMELRNQYVLGYKSSNARRNGAWRKIRVKMCPEGISSPQCLRQNRLLRPEPIRGRLSVFVIVFFLPCPVCFCPAAHPRSSRPRFPRARKTARPAVRAVIVLRQLLPDQVADQPGCAARFRANDRSVFNPGLAEENFQVLEDKVEQKLSVFKQEDVPVSFGLVVDNSGSMRSKRPQVNAAAITFVKTSNASDEGFVVNFNDDYYLDTEHDFTSDLNEMRSALERIDARGSTALYDAVIGSLDHLKKGTRDKKVLLVVTDGEDNASRHSLENAVEQAQRAGCRDFTRWAFSATMTSSTTIAPMDEGVPRLLILRPRLAASHFSPKTPTTPKPSAPRSPTTSATAHARLLPDENAARDGSFRTVAVQVTRAARRRKAFRAHAHRVLRAPRPGFRLDVVDLADAKDGHAAVRKRVHQHRFRRIDGIVVTS